MKFLDFILGRQSNSSPNYLVGVTSTSTVKVPISSIGAGLIGKLVGANMNTTSDQLITLTGGTRFIINNIVITNASTSLTVANNAKFYTGTSHSGDFIADSGQLSSLTVSKKFIDITTTQSISTDTAVSLGNSLYFSLGLSQGALATADIYIFGYVIS